MQGFLDLSLITGTCVRMSMFVYLCGPISHVTDHSSLAGDNTGQLFGEGRVLKLPQLSSVMEREALSH